VDSKHSQPAASAAPIPNAQPSAAASVELDQSLADAQRMSDEKDEFARSRGIAPLSSGHREHADIGDVDADGALFGSGEPLLRPDNDVSDGLVGRVSAPAPAAVSLQSHLEQQRRIDQTKTLLTSGIHEHGLKPRDISDNLFPTNGAELYAQTQRPMRPNNLVWQLVPHVTYDNAEPKVKSISTEDEIGYEAIYVGMVHSLGEIRPDDNVTKAVVDAYLYPRVPTWTMLLKQMPVMDILLRTC
jgi:hypothetical protein